MIVVLGSVVAPDDRLAEAVALSEEHVRRSRAEPGCLSHAVHRDTENPSKLVFVERWENREALWAHFAVPASRAFGKALVALGVEAPTIEILDATPIALPGRGG